MKKRVFRKRYEDAIKALEVFEKLDKAEPKAIIVEKPNIKKTKSKVKKG